MKLSSLTAAQIDTLKAWLTANAAGLSDGDAALLSNAAASPSYAVWRTTVKREEVQRASGFDWTRVDNLSVGKSRIWDWMFNSTDTMPVYLANYRTGINAVWVGTQADLDVRTAVIAACGRPVTNAEKLFVVATSDGPAQSGSRGTATNPDQLGTSTVDGVTRLEGGLTEVDVTFLRQQ